MAAPGYFAGRLSFGELMMVVGAFNQVQQSLRWFVDNTSAIADWRATLLRVMNFRQALLELDAVEAGAGLIERSEDPAGRFRLDAVRVETRHGCITLDPPLLEVAPGERVLIHGKPGSGRTSFFLAIAGLWSAGSGRISVPPDAEVAYLTQRPFLPSGSLRAALARGRRARTTDEAMRAALGGSASTTSRAPSTPPPAGTASSGSASRSGFLCAAAARAAEVADLRRGPRPGGRGQPGDAAVDPGGTSWRRARWSTSRSGGSRRISTARTAELVASRAGSG